MEDKRIMGWMSARGVVATRAGIAITGAAGRARLVVGAAGTRSAGRGAGSCDASRGGLRFLANTGCRAGEALALTWDHADTKDRIARIWPSEEWQPKSNRPREVPFDDVLAPWLSGERQSSRWVFPAPRPGERHARWPKRHFDRARQEDGLTGGPHTLRHPYASHFFKTTPDLILLARVLGHSDARVTKIYAHLLPDHLAKAHGAVSMPAPVGPAALDAAKRWKASAAATGTAPADQADPAETVPATVPAAR